MVGAADQLVLLAHQHRQITLSAEVGINVSDTDVAAASACNDHGLPCSFGVLPTRTLAGSRQLGFRSTRLLNAISWAKDRLVGEVGGWR